MLLSYRASSSSRCPSLLLLMICQHLEDPVLHLVEPLSQPLGWERGPAVPLRHHPPLPLHMHPATPLQVPGPLFSPPLPNLPSLTLSPPPGKLFPLCPSFSLSHYLAAPQGPLLRDQTIQGRPPMRQGATVAQAWLAASWPPSPLLPGDLYPPHALAWVPWPPSLHEA